jgi:hypothetical protein
MLSFVLGFGAPSPKNGAYQGCSGDLTNYQAPKAPKTARIRVVPEI